jgi:hypothetical protein
MKIISYIIATHMRKLIVSGLLAAAVLAFPARILATDSEQIICPQAYGGGVVCGVHTPVNTGLGDNLAVAGGVLLVSSVIFSILSRKFKRISA